MKTKAINQLTSALLAMFVIIMFAFSACSSDDSNDDPPAPDPTPIGYQPGDVIPAGDYPSITFPNKNQFVQQLIGAPVYGGSHLYNGEFHVIINRAQSDNWHLKGYRPNTTLCTWGNRNIYPNGTFWSNALPTVTFSWNSAWPTCNSQSKTVNLSWDEAKVPLGHSKITRKLLDGQEWEPVIVGNIQKIGDYTYTSLYSLPDTPPKVYISFDRDWKVANDDTYSQGSRTHLNTTFVGFETTEINEFTTTLGIEVEAEYDNSLASIKTTLNAEWENQITNSHTWTEESFEQKEHNFTVPQGEEWRYIKLQGNVKYYFSDENGDKWESEYLKIGNFPILTGIDNTTKEYLMKYKSGVNKAYSVELIGNENLE